MVIGAAEVGVNLVIHSTGKTTDQLLDLVSSRSVDGIVVHCTEDDPIVRILEDFKIPAVSFADRVPGISAVVVDDAAGGVLQAHHLAKCGHRHALVKRSPHTTTSGTARVNAFRERWTSMGLKVTEIGNPSHYELDPEEIDILTAMNDRATCLVAWNDVVAESACRTLDDLGVQIPQEVAIIGFDGIEQPERQRYELTTIKAPWGEVGRTAAKQLKDLIDGKPCPPVTKLPVAFLRGKTT
jgi:DNA-binding LacI/PurR family transcriptional regulator